MDDRFSFVEMDRLRCGEVTSRSFASDPDV